MKIDLEIRKLQAQNDALVEKLTSQGQETKDLVLGRMDKLENQFKNITGSLKDFTELVDDLDTMFKRDYAEFVRDRKRWKSDFDRAT